MSIKNIFSFAASIIKLFIILFLLSLNSNSAENNIKQYSPDEGVLSIMYHRFNETKYPSTNIKMNIFLEHINLIKKLGYQFLHPEKFKENFDIPKKDKKILLTIDDGLKSFYDNAWPYLKEKKIPFILFVSTKPVGNNGYMTWDQIKEIDKHEFAIIGHHSHSHEYLIDKSQDEFLNDMKTANQIFQNELGYVPILFSYPFGEYSKFMRDYVSENFKIAFGQHSGIIDVNKNKFELPRFPINEKYGKIDRFNTIIRTLPLKYEFIEPEEKYINDKTNPPKVTIKFAENYNLKLLNCFSNENDKWRQSKIDLVGDKTIKIDIKEKFITERGRINCSLRENNNSYRWLGIQFVIAEK